MVRKRGEADRITIDPRKPLPPLSSAGRAPAPSTPTGAEILRRRGAQRLVAPDPIPPGRFSGLDALRVSLSRAS